MNYIHRYQEFKSSREQSEMNNIRRWEREYEYYRNPPNFRDYAAEDRDARRAAESAASEISMREYRAIQDRETLAARREAALRRQEEYRILNQRRDEALRRGVEYRLKQAASTEEPWYAEQDRDFVKDNAEHNKKLNLAYRTFWKDFGWTGGRQQFDRRFYMWVDLNGYDDKWPWPTYVMDHYFKPHWQYTPLFKIFTFLWGNRGRPSLSILLDWFKDLVPHKDYLSLASDAKKIRENRKEWGYKDLTERAWINHHPGQWLRRNRWENGEQDFIYYNPMNQLPFTDYVHDFR